MLSKNPAESPICISSGIKNIYGRFSSQRRQKKGRIWTIGPHYSTPFCALYLWSICTMIEKILIGSIRRRIYRGLKKEIYIRWNFRLQWVRTAKINRKTLSWSKKSALWGHKKNRSSSRICRASRTRSDTNRFSTKTGLNWGKRTIRANNRRKPYCSCDFYELEWTSAKKKQKAKFHLSCWGVSKTREIRKERKVYLRFGWEKRARNFEILVVYRWWLISNVFKRISVLFWQASCHSIKFPWSFPNWRNPIISPSPPFLHLQYRVFFSIKKISFRRVLIGLILFSGKKITLDAIGSQFTDTNPVTLKCLTRWVLLSNNMKSHFSLPIAFSVLGAKESFIEKLKKYDSIVKFNNSPVQAPFSDKCGQFCIAFLLMRIFNIDQTFGESLNSLFSADLEQNEIRVLDFIE